MSCAAEWWLSTSHDPVAALGFPETLRARAPRARIAPIANTALYLGISQLLLADLPVGCRALSAASKRFFAYRPRGIRLPIAYEMGFYDSCRPENGALSRRTIGHRTLGTGQRSSLANLGIQARIKCRYAT